MTHSYRLNEVFTPSRPARVTFVDRDKINNRIVRALRTPGTQIVIYGHTGSGKTTLLENKLFQVYEKHIKTNCMKGMSFDQILLDAFDQLGEFYCDEITNKRKTTVDASAQATYLSIKTQLKVTSEDEVTTKKKRILPPQLTPQSLARLMGQAGYCWVLEDFHKVDAQHKQSLSQMMTVFMDLSDQYEDLKIIALGAVNTAREVVQYDKEMRKRVSEIHVDLMSPDEIKEIIKKGGDALNVIINKALSNDIVHYSNGLAAICHKLCYIMCDTAEILEAVREPLRFDATDLQAALSEYLQEESDTIKSAFDKALKLKSGEETLRIVSLAARDGTNVEDLLDLSKTHGQRISIDKLRENLSNLETEQYGEVLKFDADSGRYSFSDPFLRAFAMAFFEEKDKSLTKKSLTTKETAALLNTALQMFLQKHRQQPDLFTISEESESKMVSQ